MWHRDLELQISSRIQTLKEKAEMRRIPGTDSLKGG